MLDSHCHLAGEAFADDLAEVAGRACAAGVDTALCILGAEDAAELARAESVRAAWPAMHFATGIHPHHAGTFAGNVTRGVEVVRSAIGSSRSCAIGEIGLDYHYDLSPREVQQDMFRAQIHLARECGLPIIIHTREATPDTFRILREEGATSGVFHCFTGDVAMAREAIELGFHLSFAGILTFPKAAELRDAATITPIDRLLTETDSPYLAPVPHRGQRNEPAFVTHVVETLAHLHGVTREALAAQITTNFNRLFGLAR
ncbi:MAG: TatD family hydrolase [Vicinamibacterales bacterium]